MASRKDEKERLRQARLEAEQRESAQARKRLWLGYAVAGILSAAVLAGIGVVALTGGGDGGGDRPAGDDSNAGVNELVGVVPDGVALDTREGTPPPAIEQADLAAAARAAGCELEEDLPQEGNDHYVKEDKEADWKTSPPTSGDHYGNPGESGTGALADGAYADQPPLSRAVHGLEHGRISIQYSPDLPEKDQLALKGVFDEDSRGVHLFPNAEMPFAVAATAWTRLLGCEEYDGAKTLDAIRDFRDKWRGRGPEPVQF